VCSPARDGSDGEEAGGLFGEAAVGVRVDAGGYGDRSRLEEAFDEEARLVQLLAGLLQRSDAGTRWG